MMRRYFRQYSCVPWCTVNARTKHFTKALSLSSSSSSLLLSAALPLLCNRRAYQAPFPQEGAMHQPGESGAETGSSPLIAGKETWSQFAHKTRYGRRRIKVIDIATKMSYEYQMLKRLCRRRPAMRQWDVRDDFCDMSPGVVNMSPSMQAAFMKVFRLKSKGEIRECLREIVPVIEYRNREECPLLRPTRAEQMIPAGETDTLNQKKRELYERVVRDVNHSEMRLQDRRAQAKLRWKIRMRLLKFQRQLAVANAVSSRAVLYSTDDAIGYFLFRGTAMYAGMHRVFFELSKLLPHFVPKTLLDFGAGTGTSILVAKEVYDPNALAYPLYRSLRQTMTMNDSALSYRLRELQYDLKRLERNNEEKKKARFMAVAALLQNGEINPADLPVKLRREIAAVAANAARNKRTRLAQESHARHRHLVDGTEWETEDALGETAANTEEPEEEEELLPGERDSDDFTSSGSDSSTKNNADHRTWWEKFVDLESDSAAHRAKKRLQPLQEITAIEPSPGMMEIGTMVLHDDVNNVTWKRYLLPEDEAIQHDLVIGAYTLSEIAHSSNRKQIVQQLWKMTKGVLVLVEFANLNNFNLLMEARDAILEEKDVGLWDWQPTIVAPCPHELRCPLRHCKSGVKRKRMRVCHTEALYKSTFVEVWARHLPLRVGIEPISYLIFARNELVPERAERRAAAVAQEAARVTQERDRKQRELYEASLSVKDVVFERLSEEALHHPSSGVPPKLPRVYGDGHSVNSLVEPESEEQNSNNKKLISPEEQMNGTHSSLSSGAKTSSSTSSSSTELTHAVKDEGAVSTGEIGHKPTDIPRLVQTSNKRMNKLIFPLSLPPATHKFNRHFVDVNYQRQRAISPAEMLVVRDEVHQLHERVSKDAHRYLRIVRDPSCHGKVNGVFCCPDGKLITGRVYRRFYGDRNRISRHSAMRWQYIGGWKLLKRSKMGSLFPNNVPMYSIETYPQIDQPNTLMGVKYSHVEKTAMQYNDPLSLTDVDEDSLTLEEKRERRKVEAMQTIQTKINQDLETIIGQKVNIENGATALGSETDSVIDARQKITPEQWADAVRRAKYRATQQTKETIPFASKMRAMRRQMEVRKRPNNKREMESNRRRTRREGHLA